MHADAESVLLADGSSQYDLWGANYFPGRGPADFLEYSSLINISPRRGNRALEIQDQALRELIRSITVERIGEGESV